VLRARVSDDWVDDYYDARDDARKQRMIARFARHAHAVFALNPDLLDALPPRAELLPYANVDPRRLRAQPLPANDPPLVVHLPTDRRVKGTDFLAAAVEGLRADSERVELRLVEGAQHGEALAAIAAADIVVDQLRTGWYGGVAVEAMALGRPVVAHVHTPDLVHLPAEQREQLPVVDATPETIDSALRRVLREDRTELGRASRAYAERWHDPLRIAERTRSAYERSVAITSTST
jgi:glycosyltransferase involved in cell wall biosynthesis